MNVLRKVLLVNDQLLGVYDLDKPIVVCADASPYGVGAILSQIYEGKEKPIVFSSGTLYPKIFANTQRSLSYYLCYKKIP